MKRSISSNKKNIPAKNIKTTRLTRFALCFFCVTATLNTHADSIDNIDTKHAPSHLRSNHIVIAAPLEENLETHAYNLAVLRLAIHKSESQYGKLHAYNSKKNYSNARALVALNKTNADVDVHITTTSKEREEHTIPIRLPIRFGVLGYRLLVIHKDNQSSFKTIKDIETLSHKKPGLVEQWVITDALKHQSITTELVHNTESVFKMLNAKRFDYSSRGVNEVYSDMEKYANGLDDVIIEPTLAVYTPIPYYIFVSKNRPKLAKIIQYGLEKSLLDGSLRKLFDHYHEAAISRAKLHQRHVIYLNNPSLPAKTPIQRKELWFFHDSKIRTHMLSNRS